MCFEIYSCAKHKYKVFGILLFISQAFSPSYTINLGVLLPCLLYITLKYARASQCMRTCTSTSVANRRNSSFTSFIYCFIYVLYLLRHASMKKTLKSTLNRTSDRKRRPRDHFARVYSYEYSSTPVIRNDRPAETARRTL